MDQLETRKKLIKRFIQSENGWRKIAACMVNPVKNYMESKGCVYNPDLEDVIAHEVKQAIEEGKEDFITFDQLKDRLQNKFVKEYKGDL